VSHAGVRARNAVGLWNKRSESRPNEEGPPRMDALVCCVRPPSSSRAHGSALGSRWAGENMFLRGSFESVNRRLSG
jgi:hypothetical protein